MRLFHSPVISFLPGPWVHLPKYLVALEATEALCASDEGADFLSLGGWRTTFIQAVSYPNSQLNLEFGISLSSSDATSRNHSLRKLPLLPETTSVFPPCISCGCSPLYTKLFCACGLFLLVPLWGAEPTSRTSAATSCSSAIHNVQITRIFNDVHLICTWWILYI